MSFVNNLIFDVTNNGNYLIVVVFLFNTLKQFFLEIQIPIGERSLSLFSSVILVIKTVKCGGSLTVIRHQCDCKISELTVNEMSYL